jgi:hypothetical protein
MEKPTYHKNPFSGDEIFGARLQVGDMLEGTDVYASTDGKWQECPFSGGITLRREAVTMIFVRPQPEP